MEKNIYNIVVKVSAIIMTIITGIILVSIWLVLMPIRILLDLSVFIAEYLTDEKNSYHNFVANSFIRYYKGVKYVYKQMIDEYNFKL